MRFFCDHDVAVQVPQRLRKLGHEAWTAAEAGLNLVADDTLTVYADDKDAVLLTHDREFSQRRRRNVVGRHIQLRCDELAAADLLEQHLDEAIQQCSAFTDVFIAISQEGMEISHRWA